MTSTSTCPISPVATARTLIIELFEHSVTGYTCKTGQPKPSADIEAIARGVEARFDPSPILSKTITQRTTKIARQLGLAEEEIRQWADAKAKLDSERRKLFLTPGGLG